MAKGIKIILFPILSYISIVTVLTRVINYANEESKKHPVFISSLELKVYNEAVFKTQHSFGVYFIVYNDPKGTFYSQAKNSARRIKKLNPDIKIAIATDRKLLSSKYFDYTIMVPHNNFDSSRQWLTRIAYLLYSPFNLTLEVDSTAHFCTKRLRSILQSEITNNLFDFSTQMGNIIPEYDSRSTFTDIIPHNFVFLYRKNLKCIEFLRRWFDFYKDKVRIMDDQISLGYMIRTANTSDIRIGKLSDSFALAFRSERTFFKGPFNRATRPFQGMVTFIHSYSQNLLPKGDTICNYINKNTTQRQIIRTASKQEYQCIYGPEDYVTFSTNTTSPARGIKIFHFYNASQRTLNWFPYANRTVKFYKSLRKL